MHRRLCISGCRASSAFPPSASCLPPAGSSTQGFPTTRIAAGRSAIIRTPLRPSSGGRHESSRRACRIAHGAAIMKWNCVYDTVVLGHEALYASLDPPPDRQRVCPLGLRDLLTAICDMNEGQDGNDVCRIHVLAPLVQLPLYPAQGVVICRTLRADLNHAVDDREALGKEDHVLVPLCAFHDPLALLELLQNVVLMPGKKWSQLEVVLEQIRGQQRLGPAS